MGQAECGTWGAEGLALGDPWASPGRLVQGAEVKATSLHETWHQLRAQVPCLLCPGAPMGLGLVGRACRWTAWEPGQAPREFTLPVWR